jgi:hypothetical protein
VGLMHRWLTFNAIYDTIGKGVTIYQIAVRQDITQSREASFYQSNTMIDDGLFEALIHYLSSIVANKITFGNY